MTYQIQITSKKNWLVVDTNEGMFCLDCEILGINNSTGENIEDFLPSFCEIFSSETIKGYGVRWSMLGYTDCSDWDIYTTKKEALLEANNLYREFKEYHPNNVTKNY